VVVGVRRAIEHDPESIVRYARLYGIVRRPILSRLLANRIYDHRDRAIELPQGFFFCGSRRLREFPATIAHVASARDVRADVVVEISRQVQHQMPDVVPIGKRILPELLVGERIDPPVQLGAYLFKIARQRGVYGVAKVWLHSIPNRSD
jgi:hypothetical protein